MYDQIYIHMRLQLHPVVCRKPGPAGSYATPEASITVKYH